MLLTDIIWGNGTGVLSSTTIVLNVTHQKDGNKEVYSDTEKIQITDADVPGLPVNQNDWTPEILSNFTKDAFLKIEVKKRESSGIIVGKISHSGVGGY